MKYTKGREDYLEAIYILSSKKGLVRTKDIATFLSVKLPSVTEVIQKLVQDGLVEHTPYGDVILTNKGRKVGKSTWDKHQAIYLFLKDILNVEEKEAFNEACLIEHSISESTIEKLEAFLKSLKLNKG